MKWNELSEMNCPIARTLAIVGDRWTLLIIRNAFMKTCRFDDFQKQLGMTRHLLAERIKRLVEHNIFEKVVYHESPKRYEYKLTEKGKALYPIIVSISVWGSEWHNENKTFQEIRYLHKSCNQVMFPQLTCSCCGEKIDARLMSPVYTSVENG